MYQIEDQTLIFSSGRRYTFPDFVAEAVAFDNLVVVRLENQGWKRSNENIWAVDYEGKFLWRIPTRVYRYGESPYVNVLRNGDNVDCYNWDGTILSLDHRTGDIQSESIVYMSNRRSPSPRRFI